MTRHKFHVGQPVYFKPGDFAPLQVAPGGEAIVTRLLDGDDERTYEIEVDFEPRQRIVRESELSARG